MARIRKSDKNRTVKTQIVWKIGKYIRLSREDGNIVSESVVNQDQILNDEIPGFFEDGLYEVVDTYIDDGNRPGASGLSAHGSGYEVRTDQLRHCKKFVQGISEQRKPGTLSGRIYPALQHPFYLPLSAEN